MPCSCSADIVSSAPLGSATTAPRSLRHTGEATAAEGDGKGDPPAQSLPGHCSAPYKRLSCSMPPVRGSRSNCQLSLLNLSAAAVSGRRRPRWCGAAARGLGRGAGDSQGSRARGNCSCWRLEAELPAALARPCTRLAARSASTASTMGWSSGRAWTGMARGKSEKYYRSQSFSAWHLTKRYTKCIPQSADPNRLSQINCGEEWQNTTGLTLLSYRKHCNHTGSNRGPCACEAHVITNYTMVAHG